MNRRAAVLAGLVLAAVGVAGCRSETPVGPPTVKYGRDQCAECGMIINEERSACALLVDAGGVPETLLFDDIGDMLDYERKHTLLRVIARYVHDHTDLSWIAAEGAVYLVGTTIQTPMGSGIVALADRGRAEVVLKESGGQVQDWAGAGKDRAGPAKAPPGN